MRGSKYVAGTTLVCAAFSLSGAGSVSSPYPATLTMQRGLTESASGHALAWGTALTGAQARWVRLSSSGTIYRWAVWKEGGGPAQFPVRSVGRGAHWIAAGPQLATDWAGGGIYFVNRVIAQSSSTVVMVSNAVIDVTTDGGHQWYQYLNAYDNWSIIAHLVGGGGVGLRIGPASYSSLPKASYAIYLLDVTHHRWRRTSESLG